MACVTPCPCLWDEAGQRNRVQASGALTAEVGAPPIQGQPPGMGTLAGVLGEGVAHTAGLVGVLTMAPVVLASLHIAAGVHQGVAA